MSEKFAYYIQLLNKVDAKFKEIQERNKQHMQCQQSCHSCCLPGLSVSSLEASHIAKFLRDHTDVDAFAREAEEKNPFHGTRCSFLNEQGACTVYEARPIVCRSHGVPIRFEDEDKQTLLDVCPLNFDNTNLVDIDAADFINIDTLNTILVTIAKQFDGNQAGARVPLRRSEIIKIDP